MRIITFVALFFLLGTSIQAQVTISGSFDFEGITRTYSFYVPAAYVPGQAVPLVLDLHGFTSDGASQNNRSNFGPIADTANFIVAHPDGSIEPFTSQRFWNYDNILGSTVNDVGFLEALIDTISAYYAINPNRIYSVGMSNGSFMSYCLACESDRFAAVGAVTGSMGVNMTANCNPSHPTPTIHIHGTDDPINPYDGNSTSLGIEAVSDFWISQNGCSTTPTVTSLPDIDATDGATAARYLYSGGINNHTVERFTITGGGHTWPGNDLFTLNGNTCMDLSASIEVWRFFSQYEKAEPASTELLTDTPLNVWPNPGNGLLSIEAGYHPVTAISVRDIQGRVVAKLSATNIQQLDLRHLEAGHYFAEFSGAGFRVSKKLVLLAE